MSTVIRRVFKATPARSAPATWAEMVNLLTRTNTKARAELESVAGIASTLITEQAPKDAPITVICDGTRTRIYCIYDDNAIDGDDANEEQLAYDPLAGDWKISLPCPEGDLAWVQGALAKKSVRISARDLSEGVNESQSSGSHAAALTLDRKGFLGS